MFNLENSMIYAHGCPEHSGEFRAFNEDFIVTEELGKELAGEGEHLCVLIEKNGENTHWVAEKLAAFFSVKPIDVGYCGKKDRHAVTTQWFSIYLQSAPTDVDWQQFINTSSLNARVIESQWHNKKLRRGEHLANHFVIRLRNVGDMNSCVQRLAAIKQLGLPNYFGEQRFGREGNNLALAQRWFEEGEVIRKRQKKSMIMSAARSYLFNLVLSERVKRDCWTSAVTGEVFDNEQPTGPLWGRGTSPAKDEALDIEKAALAGVAAWADGLEHVGLQQERRILCLRPVGLSWSVLDGDLELKFSLQPGQFATSVLREICTLVSPAPINH